MDDAKLVILQRICSFGARLRPLTLRRAVRNEGVCVRPDDDNCEQFSQICNSVFLWLPSGFASVRPSDNESIEKIAERGEERRARRCPNGIDKVNA